MHDTENDATGEPESAATSSATTQPRRRRAASRAAGPPAADGPTTDAAGGETAAETAAATSAETATSAAAAKKRAPRKRVAAKTTAATADAATAAPTEASPEGAAPNVADAGPADTGPADAERAGAPDAAVKRPARKRTAKSRATADGTVSAEAPASKAEPNDAGREPAAPEPAAHAAAASESGAAEATTAEPRRGKGRHAAAAQAAVLFQAPAFEAEPAAAPATERPARPVRSTQGSSGGSTPEAETGDAAKAPRSTTRGGASNRAGSRAAQDELDLEATDQPADTAEATADTDAGVDSDTDEDGTPRRRRRRGGRGRRKRSDDVDDAADTSPEADADDEPENETRGRANDGAGPADSGDDSDGDDTNSRRRRRRRKRKGDSDDDSRPDDPPNTVVKVRDHREGDDEVTSVKGSTRLEAKKQRRREGREAGRRRPPILSEAEFLARREAVDRVMAVRQSGDLTQIAVLEDDVLVEHYVSRASQQSLIGNVYLGRVQNVLPAMEAAFVDIGRGRNAVLYAGEVDWSGLGKSDGPKRIEEVLKSGQAVLVQVTKDPIGHKGARLTSQVSLPGRYVVYVPGGSMSGISRKLPDTERTRLKKILREVVPDDAGVIVRTAAEGASEEELTNDVSRLQAQWEAIEKKANGNAPVLLQGEPDLAIKVVRDLFNEDFAKLVISGAGAWDSIDEYVTSVAGSLHDRVERWTSNDDVFAAYRIDEQIAKALDRKVWLPSGGSLVIDRTEAMTVVDVNTGKFTGSGGNLEETVTKNNLEAAEEIVRQLRLRDIGGIIVIDFIDMVLEANRDLVLRRLVECLGRDRTKHQVAEVTSLGLVQMTRKRIGTGLLEAFSEPCPHCNGRGVVVHAHPVESAKSSDDNGNGHGGGNGGGRSERRGRRRKNEPEEKPAAEVTHAPKLEALATPGEASPADLIPVANGGDAPDAAHEPAGAPVVGANGTADAVAADGAPADGAPADATPAKPPARRRRRATRPAAAPDVTTANGAGADGSTESSGSAESNGSAESAGSTQPADGGGGGEAPASTEVPARA